MEQTIANIITFVSFLTLISHFPGNLGLENKMCGTVRITVEYKETDYQKQHKATTTIKSSESFQKNTKQYEHSFERGAGFKGFSVNVNTAFSKLNSDSLRNKNYKETDELGTISYSPDSTQLWRVKKTEIDFKGPPSSGLPPSEPGTVVEERYIMAVSEACQNIKRDMMWNMTLDYMQREYKDKDGTINGNVYTEDKCAPFRNYVPY